MCLGTHSAEYDHFTRLIPFCPPDNDQAFPTFHRKSHTTGTRRGATESRESKGRNRKNWVFIRALLCKGKEKRRPHDSNSPHPLTTTAAA